MKHCVIFWLVSLLHLSGCSSSDGRISSQIESQLKDNQNRPINLALLGPFDWDRVCVLTPYSNNDNAQTVLGFTWNATGKTSIGGSDTINVLVFALKNEVVAYVEHPRNKGDFSELLPRCLTRAKAWVVRQPDANGWIYLVASP
jgi:hypothetical protein